MHTLKKPQANFTMVPNGVLGDRGLTLKAKGLYSLMFSKPDGWTFYEDTLTAESGDGRHATRAALEELLQAGWITRTRCRGVNKQFQPYQYELHLTCQKARPQPKSRVRKSDAGGSEPHLISRRGKPAADNQTLINTDSSKTDNSKTDNVSPPSDERNGFTKSLGGVLGERISGLPRKAPSGTMLLADMLEPFGGKVPADWIPLAVIMHKMLVADAEEAAAKFVFYYTQGNGKDVYREDVGAWAQSFGVWCKGAMERKGK